MLDFYFNLNKSVNFSIIIGDRKYRNKVRFRDFKCCINYIFRQFKLNSINAEVIFNNKAAVKIYKKMIFMFQKLISKI